MLRFFTLALSLFVWAIFINVAIGHEIVEVKNGASLKGTVTFQGTVPDDETIVIDRNTSYCGEEQKLQKYVISDSRVKNVVVWIDNVSRGKAIAEKTVEIRIKDCKIASLVNVGYVGGAYRFRNDDDILHTLQLKLGLSYQKKVSGRPLKEGATIYNLAFPKKGLAIEKPIKRYHAYSDKTGYIRVKSNTHNWMRGYVFIFDHPYAAVTDEKGIFVIDDLFPGEYVLKAWHEGFGMQERKIKIASGETLEVEIEYGK